MNLKDKVIAKIKCPILPAGVRVVADLVRYVGDPLGTVEELLEPQDSLQLHGARKASDLKLKKTHDADAAKHVYSTRHTLSSGDLWTYHPFQIRVVVFKENLVTAAALSRFFFVMSKKPADKAKAENELEPSLLHCDQRYAGLYVGDGSVSFNFVEGPMRELFKVPMSPHLNFDTMTIQVIAGLVHNCLEFFKDDDGSLDTMLNLMLNQSTVTALEQWSPKLSVEIAHRRERSYRSPSQDNGNVISTIPRTGHHRMAVDGLVLPSPGASSGHGGGDGNSFPNLGRPPSYHRVTVSSSDLQTIAEGLRMVPTNEGRIRLLEHLAGASERLSEDSAGDGDGQQFVRSILEVLPPPQRAIVHTVAPEVPTSLVGRRREKRARPLQDDISDRQSSPMPGLSDWLFTWNLTK